MVTLSGTSSDDVGEAILAVELSRCCPNLLSSSTGHLRIDKILIRSSFVGATCNALDKWRSTVFQMWRSLQQMELPPMVLMAVHHFLPGTMKGHGRSKGYIPDREHWLVMATTDDGRSSFNRHFPIMSEIKILSKGVAFVGDRSCLSIIVLTIL